MNNRPADAQDGSAHSAARATRSRRKSRSSKRQSQRYWPRPHLCSRAKIAAVIDAAGLSDLPADSQAAAVLLVEHARTTRHRHAVHDEAIAIDRDLWRHLFRRHEVARVRDALFILAASDDHPAGYYSKALGIARGYRLRPEIEATAATFDARIGEDPVLIEGTTTHSLQLDGALIPSDTGGDLLPTIPSWLPINLPAVLREIAVLDQVLADNAGTFEGLVQLPAQFDDSPTIVRAADHDPRVLRETHRDLRRIAAVAQNQTHPGMIPQVYRQVPSGRFCGIGFSLQNCRKLVRAITLEGYQSIDVRACHHSIMCQIARSNGLACPQLDALIADSKRYRQDLATAIGCTLDQAKTALIAIGFGAAMFDTADTALADLLGRAGLRRALRHPPLRALAKELQQIRPLVDARRFIGPDPATGKRPALRQRVASILQWEESRILLTCLGHTPDAVLPIHDGFVCRPGTDPGLEALMQKIAKQTGWHVELTPERVQIPGLAEVLEGA